jgi:fumarylacetoacetate (FAA) hydrolase family protein
VTIARVTFEPPVEEWLMSAILPWTFGTAALMKNLTRRGLL